MEFNPKFVKLLAVLRDATDKGRVDWTETADEDTFRVLLDHAAVRVTKEIDDINERINIVASLADFKGDTLDRISTEDVNDEVILSLLHSLYDMARKRVRKVDDILDRLITDLNARSA